MGHSCPQPSNIAMGSRRVLSTATKENNIAAKSDVGENPFCPATHHRTPSPAQDILTIATTPCAAALGSFQHNLGSRRVLSTSTKEDEIAAKSDVGETPFCPAALMPRARDTVLTIGTTRCAAALWSVQHNLRRAKVELVI